MDAKNLAELHGLPLVDWQRVEARLAEALSSWPGPVVTTTAAGRRPRVDAEMAGRWAAEGWPAAGPPGGSRPLGGATRSRF